MVPNFLFFGEKLGVHVAGTHTADPPTPRKARHGIRRDVLQRFRVYAQGTRLRQGVPGHVRSFVVTHRSRSSTSRLCACWQVPPQPKSNDSRRGRVHTEPEVQQMPARCHTTHACTGAGAHISPPRLAPACRCCIGNLKRRTLLHAPEVQANCPFD